MKKHICVGCGKVLPAGSIKRDEACRQGWRFCQIDRNPIFAQCGCLSADEWSRHIKKKMEED